jgi:predicted anti-sigma-YlaC factor YlaD
VIGVVGILHRSDEQLELYALGRLPEPSVAEVEEHLLVCPACRERVDDLEAYAFAMRQAISTEPAKPSHWLSRFRCWFQRSRLKMPVLAWAAGLAAILFAVTLYLQFIPHLAPLATLQLTAMRGAMPSVGPSRETDITLADAPTGAALRAKIVDATGSTVWSGALDPRTHRIALTRQFAPGSYFVRLFDDNGKLLHEYGFQVHGSL